MWFRVLGPVAVEVDGQTVPIARRRERYLLGVLAFEANRPVPVARLGELLWDHPPPGIRRLVQSHVARLRSVLRACDSRRHGVALESGEHGYVLRTDPDRVDALRFRALLARADTGSLRKRAELLRAALELWPQPLPPPADDVIWWRVFGHLDELRATAYENWFAAGLQLGDASRLIPEMARLVGTYPTRERLVEMYMTALDSAGRGADALAAFTRPRAVLADELGIEPGPRLREVHLAILSRSGPPPSLPGPTDGPVADPADPADPPPDPTVPDIDRVAAAMTWAGDEADAFNRLAEAAYTAGQPERARGLFATALALATVGGHPHRAARSHTGLGQVFDALRDPDRARHHRDRADGR